MLRLIGLAAILVASPVALNAQATGNDALLLQCRALEKKSQRLECFDNAMDTIFGVDEVAEAEREQLRRDNFGNLAAEEQDTADAYSGTITHVDFNQTYRILRLQLDNGSIWEAKTSGSLNLGFLQPGEQVTIEKGALGTFKLSVAGKKGWRGVKRID
ncbi:hypothetical protein K3181_11520 [Qipengyuania sp. YG27]|uniref:Uncharacterized protein n=1 Tax=Qipengyuania mesophila TaxID=2867246 RepID=A0ABS7JWP0_9SPHN|nr:hypothetical protein [Qipengyuania mesophila]MBX7502072.1 hypothetical protein [Qipengyuania mesophila]